ncbi:Receptor-type tyrosine- phosphatase delta, partial [Paramuricea clavata]
IVLLPINLTVTNIKSRSAEISWPDPKDRERFGVSRFWIKLKKENSLILNITTGRVNEYEISNLTPYTTYEISVAAGNDYGFGEESNTSFLTSEEAPSSPPLNIRTTSRNASSLSFAWDPPDTTKQNGVIISYTACISHSENGPCFHTFITSERRWLFVNLNPLTKYYVRVLASTKAGHGNYSESKGIFTSGKIVLLPINLTIINIKSRSAEISWPDPKDYERFGVSRFWIKLKKENSLILNITTGKVNKYEINNLTPYTTYEISVAPGNDYGFSKESITSFLTSEEAPSGPPLNIRTTSRSASSLSFAWDPPDTTKQNGVIISYTVCISHSENGACFQTFNTGVRKWLVINLNPLSKYYVRVLASTKVGHGNYSESKGLFTSGNLVLLPVNLTVTNIKSRSAEISWQDPKDHERFGVSRFWVILKKENSLILNITTGKVNKFEINNLTPDTTYEISVAAETDYYGFGEESITSFLTSEEAPSGPPLNIRTTSRSASSLSFAWDPPHTTKQNGVIVSYTACVSHSGNGPCFQTFTTSENKWLVIDLNPLTKYYVRVLASTKVGHGNYSEGVGFFTNGKPAEKAIAKTSSTLTFSLKIPSETFVYFYVVALKLKDGKEPASSDSYQNNELVTYVEAEKSSNPTPYIAAVVTSSGVDGNVFVLGDSRNTDDRNSRKRRSTSSDYFNGPLEPGTSYSVFQRIIINEMGEYYSTDWSPPSKTSEGQVPSDVPDTDDNDDGSKNYLFGMIALAILLVIVGTIIALYFICQNHRRKSSSTKANVEKTNDVSNSQYIYDDVGNYEQVDDEQSTYTGLNRPGEVIDDHLYAHLNDVTQNMYADQKETGF